MKQGINPILPLWEYIPDGEPHVFGDRIYLFGSHDKEGASKYCEWGNYVGWSAPLSDPANWSCSGEIYSPKQDPFYVPGDNTELYAPDVMQGNDGRFYLYYCFGGTAGHSRIGVAVCDTPDGRYEYYGSVRNPDGSVCHDYLMGDPGVMNDDGVPRLYAGWSLSMVAAAAHARGRGTSNADQNKPSGEAQGAALPQPGDPLMNVKLAPLYRMMFHRSLEEVKDLRYPLMGANAYTLCEDMLTVKDGPHRIVPGQFDTPRDSSFFGHAFYEASSIRKINGLYYFIYSSENSNELCYATSRYPDRDFVFGGTIISNGDVGYLGRSGDDRTNQTGNDHGSLVKINDRWYIFHHRQTHRGTFSRQACAEPVTILPDGRIPQVECTSMGLNAGYLRTEGCYPAVCCCVLTNGSMPHITNTALDEDIPHITNDGDERFITGIKNGVTIGYKYFDFTGKTRITLQLRGEGGGRIRICTVPVGTPITSERQVPQAASGCTETAVPASSQWTQIEAEVTACTASALYFLYEGSGSCELQSFSFRGE